jgi:hypothetical protein
MEKVQETSNSGCHTQILEPFRIYLKELIFIFGFQIFYMGRFLFCYQAHITGFCKMYTYLIIQFLIVQNENLLKLTEEIWSVFVSLFSEQGQFFWTPLAELLS